MSIINKLASNKKYLAVIAIVTISVVIGSIFLYKYIVSSKAKNNYVINHDEATHGTGCGSKVATVYFFFVTWCPHSVAAISEWEKVVDKYTDNNVNGYKINLVDVDCTKETVEIENLINKYDIEGYPTVKMIKGDEVIDFNAKVKFENVEKFLSSVL